MLDGCLERLRQVVAVRLPRSDVAGVELEDAETKIAREHRVLILDLSGGPEKTFSGQLGDTTGPLQLIAEGGSGPLIVVLGVKRLGKLDEEVVTIASVN